MTLSACFHVVCFRFWFEQHLSWRWASEISLWFTRICSTRVIHRWQNLWTRDRHLESVSTTRSIHVFSLLPFNHTTFSFLIIFFSSSFFFNWSLATPVFQHHKRYTWRLLWKLIYPSHQATTIASTQCECGAIRWHLDHIFHKIGCSTHTATETPI